MAKPFSIRDFISSDVRQQDSDSDINEKVSVYDIGLNPRNEYVMSEIEKIKDSIYALGGVQQNVVLVRCPEGADHKYLALDGHRRLTAVRELVAEGYAEFEYVPAVIKGRIDPDTEEAMLVMMNSTQRNKTDYEKVMEHMRLKEIIPKLKKRQGADGRTRDIEADMLGVSRGQISIYNTIGTRLNAGLMQLFKNGDIGISLAHAAAQLKPELQQELVYLANATGRFDEEDIKMLLDRRPVKRQIANKPEVDENVPESGTSERCPDTAGTLLGDDKNVPESGTFGGGAEIPAGILAESGKNVSESDTFEEQEAPVTTLAAGDKNVPESGTFEESVPTVPDSEDCDKESKGGYTLTMVDGQIRKYADWLDMAIDNGISHLICEYSCLLDALKLLKEKMLQ